MYDELVSLLRKKYDKAPMVMQAAGAIEELGRLAEVNAKRAMKWAFDAEKAEEKPRWIPVTEQLPSPEVEVLVYTKGQRIGIDKYFGTIFGEPTFSKKGMNRVTHWQSLPEPPKKAIQNDEAPAGPYDLLYEEGGPDA